MAKWFELPDLPIRITARGTWLHGDEPLHPRVEKLFACNVVPALDGYYVQLGYARQKLEVEDTAFSVKSLDAIEAPAGTLSRVVLRLSDGSEEELDPCTLMQSADNVFYCRIKRHGLSVPCRFAPAHYHTLALHADFDGDAAVLPLGAARWPIKPYEPQPLAL